MIPLRPPSPTDLAPGIRAKTDPAPTLCVEDLFRGPLTPGEDLYWLTSPRRTVELEGDGRHMAEVRAEIRTHPDVTVQWVRKHDHERRVWVCGIACWRGRPFMVFQNGGREGDDEHDRWVFDGTCYVHAVRALADCNTVRAPKPIRTYWRIPGMGVLMGRHRDETDPPWDQVSFDRGEY